MKGIANNIQFNWLKFEVPGSNIFSTCVIIYLVLSYIKLFFFKEGFTGIKGFVVLLLVHVIDPIINSLQIISVRKGLKVFSKVSLIKVKGNFSLTN